MSALICHEHDRASQRMMCVQRATRKITRASVIEVSGSQTPIAPQGIVSRKRQLAARCYVRLVARNILPCPLPRKRYITSRSDQSGWKIKKQLFIPVFVRLV
jgi:hypothetical protein